MRTHLLLTVCSDLSSHHGINFVSSFFHNKATVDLTLLNVQPGPGSDLSMISTDWRGDSESADAAAIDPATETAMNKYMANLVKNGFDKSRIHSKIAKKNTSIVRDIIWAGSSEKYDAVVLGRRSSSMLEDLLVGSVSRDLLEQPIDFPLWICRDPDILRKNVLLCLDGSPSSLRAADHLGYILQQETGHYITLLHIAQGNKKDQHSIFAAATTILKNYGISPDRMILKVIKTSRVSNAIQEEIDDQQYAAVALGWTGQTHTSVTSFLAGATSKDLFKTLAGTALIVVK